MYGLCLPVGVANIMNYLSKQYLFVRSETYQVSWSVQLPTYSTTMFDENDSESVILVNIYDYFDKKIYPQLKDIIKVSQIDYIS